MCSWHWLGYHHYTVTVINAKGTNNWCCAYISTCQILILFFDNFAGTKIFRVANKIKINSTTLVLFRLLKVSEMHRQKFMCLFNVYLLLHTHFNISYFGSMRLTLTPLNMSAFTKPCWPKLWKWANWVLERILYPTSLFPEFLSTWKVPNATVPVLMRLPCRRSWQRGQSSKER